MKKKIDESGLRLAKVITAATTEISGRPPEGYNRPRKFYDCMKVKSEKRERAIDKLVAEASAKQNACTDRFYHILVHDLENAEMTTNQAQLLEIGIDTATATLWEIINGLADLNIFLLHSNHLTDTQLLFRLCEEITTEQVRDLPPSFGVNEFVDLTGNRNPAGEEIRFVCDRDQHLPKPTTESPESVEVITKDGETKKLTHKKTKVGLN